MNDLICGSEYDGQDRRKITCPFHDLRGQEIKQMQEDIAYIPGIISEMNQIKQAMSEMRGWVSGAKYVLGGYIICITIIMGLVGFAVSRTLNNLDDKIIQTTAANKQISLANKERLAVAEGQTTEALNYLLRNSVNKSDFNEFKKDIKLLIKEHNRSVQNED